jgi:hypothetical protein
MKTLDFMFNADYRRNLPLVKDTMEYYEVTKAGKIIYHDKRDWKLNGFTLKDNKLVKVIVN